MVFGAGSSGAGDSREMGGTAKASISGIADRSRDNRMCGGQKGSCEADRRREVEQIKGGFIYTGVVVSPGALSVFAYGLFLFLTLKVQLPSVLFVFCEWTPSG